MGGIRHAMERDARRSCLRAWVRRWARLAFLATALTCWLAVGTAAADPPSNGGGTAPVITGTAQQGDTLTVSNGTWTGDPTGYTYAWWECDDSGDPCSQTDDTSGTYVLQASDVDSTLYAVVTASNADGDGSATSASVGPVLPPAPSNRR